MSLKAVIKMKAHIVCPHCGNGDGYACDHILSGGEWAGGFGPWSCDDCGHSITGKLMPDGSLDIEEHAEQWVKTIDVLMLPPQSKPVYFVLETKRWIPAADSWMANKPEHDEAAGKRFLYESHSCPTNWLKPAMMYYDGDSDPHGLIEFVATRDDATFPPDESVGPNARDEAFVAFIEECAAKIDRGVIP